jgi:hypothetical protein
MKQTKHNSAIGGVNSDLEVRKMKTERIQKIAESYINGNISETKESVKRMSKLDFVILLSEIAFLEDHKISSLLGIGVKLTK